MSSILSVHTLRRVSYLTLLFVTPVCLFAQFPDLAGTWAEPSADGVLINIRFGNNPLSPIQIVFQRYNEFGDTVGGPTKRPVTTDPGKTVQIALNSDDIKGAASILYFISGVSSPSTTTSVPVKVDLTAFRKNDQLRKDFDDYRVKSERDSAQAKDTYNADLKAKDRDNAALRARLAELNKRETRNFLPRNISLQADPEVTPTSVGFAIRVDKPGPIQVTALLDTDQRSEVITVKSDTPLTLHNVKIDKNLAPGATYRFEVRVLNFDGSVLPDGDVLTRRNDGRLRIPLPASVSAPNVTFSPPEVSQGKFKIKVAPDARALISAELFEQSGVNLVSVKKDGVVLAKDVFGRPTNPDNEYTPKDTDKTFEFDSLKPKGSYQLAVTAVDSLGQATAHKYSDPISIPERAPDFDFTGSLELEISPLGFQATWNATTAPKSGSFQVVFKNDTITSPPAKIDGKKLTASLDATALQQFYKQATAKTQPKTDDNPSIDFTMANETSSKKASVKISYTIPTQAQVDDAVKNGILSADDKKKLTDVISSATNNKKSFKWADFLSTGLGIILKFL